MVEATPLSHGARAVIRPNGCQVEMRGSPGYLLILTAAAPPGDLTTNRTSMGLCPHLSNGIHNIQTVLKGLNQFISIKNYERA